ncbi:MAG TPA: FG-GAP-like repeat-containing protein [Candidatus Limnocylindrales bacterium]
MRRIIFPIVSAIAGALVLTMAPTAAHAAPPTPAFGPAIDGYAAYDGQDTCDPSAKPGVIDFSNLLQQTYGRANWGIVRACDLGGQSEHKEGRALDYPFNANDSAQLAQANDLLNWLLAPDQYGNQHAMARRLGLMYIVWNHQQWRAYSSPSSWRPRACDGSANDCHTNHIHFSFSWAGALRQTTWWTGRTGPGNRAKSDFNGDGRSDMMVYRPSEGNWHVRFTGGGQTTLNNGQWGDPNDRPLTGDYDGDGKDDMMIFRPSTGQWLVKYTANNHNATLTSNWGGPEDTVMSGDYNGDGRADMMVYRPSEGNWYVRFTGGGQTTLNNGQWGDPNDRPLTGDYDGDGKDDMMIFRPSTGQGLVKYTANNHNATLTSDWGGPDDIVM